MLLGKKTRALKIVFLFVLLLALHAAEATSAPFTLVKTASGTVNGQPVDGVASGTADPNTGVYTLDWTFNSVPTGFSVWGSIVTKASSIGAATSRTRSGAANLLTLSGGNYTIHEVAKFPGGDVLITDVIVSTAGNTITSDSILSGSVSLPPLEGIWLPDAEWLPGPGQNQFVERVTKYLILEGGAGEIPVQVEATFTLDSGQLSDFQIREQKLKVINATPDAVNPSTATIRYESALHTRSIPTLSWWAIVLFSGLLGTSAILLLRRRRASSAAVL